MSDCVIYLDSFNNSKGPVIRVRFSYDQEIIRRIKLIQGARWNPSDRCWMFPCTFHHLSQLRETFTEYGAEIHEGAGMPLSPEEMEVNERIESHLNPLRKYMRSKRYSEQTTVVYENAMRMFLRFNKDKLPSE